MTAAVPTTVLAHIFPVLFLLLVAMLAVMGKVTPVVPIAYVIASIVTFAAYGVDKAAAEKRNRRIPEKVLHWCSLAGGWPGALLAQRLLHHKTRKRAFRTYFWVTVAVNCLILGAALQ